MRRSTHVLLTAVIIAALIIAPPAATAQTKIISTGVAMTNVYDAFGSERNWVNELICREVEGALRGVGLRACRAAAAVF